MINSKQMALVHLAKKRLGFDDDTYRAVLIRLAGVESAKDLDSIGFDRVMDYFDQNGFRSDWKKRTFGNRPGFASPSQIDLIKRLWRQWSEQGDDAGLDRWLERKFHVSALRFVTPDIAHKAITALKAMAARKGRVA